MGVSFASLCAEANKIKIVQQGAVAALLKLTRVHDPRVQRNAAGALLNLTHIGEHGDTVFNSGGSRGLMSIILRNNGIPGSKFIKLLVIHQW